MDGRHVLRSHSHEFCAVITHRAHRAADAGDDVRRRDQDAEVSSTCSLSQMLQKSSQFFVLVGKDRAQVKPERILIDVTNDWGHS
mgnify:CR=1 FL=1